MTLGPARSTADRESGAGSPPRDSPASGDARRALARSALAAPRASPPAVRPGPPAPATLWQALAARQQAVRAMNARVRATSWIGGDRVRATVLMLVDRAGRLRFEAEVSLQGTVSILDHPRRRLPDARRAQRKAAAGPGLPRQRRVADPHAARARRGGGDPARRRAGCPRRRAAGAQVEWDAGRGADALVVRDGSAETRVFFRPDKPDEIVGAAVAGPDGPRWRASYEDLAPVGGRTAPARNDPLRRARDSYDQGVEIRFKDRTLNADMPADSFTSRRPPAPRSSTWAAALAPG